MKIEETNVVLHLETDHDMVAIYTITFQETDAII